MKNKTTYCVRSRGGQTYNRFWKDTYTLNAINGYLSRGTRWRWGPYGLICQVNFFTQGERIHDCISKTQLQWENRRRLGISSLKSVKIQWGRILQGPQTSQLRPGFIYVFNIWRQQLLARCPPTPLAFRLPQASTSAEAMDSWLKQRLTATRFINKCHVQGA